MLANLMLASYQKRMGESSNVHPGDEMIAAIKKADELGIPQEMVDRPIAVTLRRAWAKNSLWGKCKLLASIIASAFSKEEVDPSQIESLKQQSEMDSMMAELSDYLPKVKEQMTAAYEFGIRDLWIVNVGDILTNEYATFGNAKVLPYLRFWVLGIFRELWLI